MKDFDYDAVIYDGEVYCKECLPSGIRLNNADVSPIFAGSEWDSFPICCACGEQHTYMNLTEHGILGEGRASGLIHYVKSLDPDVQGWYCEDRGPYPTEYAACDVYIYSLIN